MKFLFQKSHSSDESVHPNYTVHRGIIRWSLAVSFTASIILALLILFKIRPGSDPIVLHYNILVGTVANTKTGWEIYQLAFLPLFITLANIILIRKFERFEPFASYVLAVTSALVACIFLIAGFALSSFI